jgi:hypothetical protein
VTSYADGRADAVGDCPLVLVIKILCHAPQANTTTHDGGDAILGQRRFVELCKVDGELAILAAKAKGAIRVCWALVLFSCWSEVNYLLPPDFAWTLTLFLAAQRTASDTCAAVSGRAMAAGLKGRRRLGVLL